jgi:hypothetical protein
MTSGDASLEEGQRHSEKKSFWSKIIGYFFDKMFGPLFVVIISGVIIFFYQEDVKHKQKIRDEAIASARKSTEMLIKQRGILMDAMVGYMQLLDEIVDKGIANSDDLKQFRKLRKAVNVAIDTLYYPTNVNNVKCAVSFREAIERPSIDLVQRRPKKYITKMSKDILDSYLPFMEELGRITRQRVIKENQEAEK